jgi:hypothetical protein
VIEPGGKHHRRPPVVLGGAHHHDRVGRSLFVTLALGPDPVGGVAAGQEDREAGRSGQADQVATHDAAGRVAPIRANL